GDGRPDFIAALRDTLGTANDFLRWQAAGGVASGKHAADFVAPSLARIYFGTDPLADTTLSATTVTLALPAPVRRASIFGSRPTIVHGNFDGDGFGDVAIAVSLDFPTPSLGTNYANSGLYILTGRAAGSWQQLTTPIDIAAHTAAGLLKPLANFAGAATISSL